MATKSAPAETHPVETAGHEDVEHPTESKYWKIFWILFVITAV
jgi:hypothetical protein